MFNLQAFQGPYGRHARCIHNYFGSSQFLFVNFLFFYYVFILFNFSFIYSFLSIFFIIIILFLYIREMSSEISGENLLLRWNLIGYCKPGARAFGNLCQLNTDHVGYMHNFQINQKFKNLNTLIILIIWLLQASVSTRFNEIFPV